MTPIASEFCTFAGTSVGVRSHEHEVPGHPGPDPI